MTLFPFTSPGSLIFEADFNGSGSGTGGPSDMVTYGGTGVIFNNNGSKLTPTISTSSPMAPGAGGNLSINDTGLQTVGGTGGGATFTPTSAANSFDAGYSTGPSFNSINGGFDFFWISSAVDFNAMGNSLRFLDPNGGNSGLRMTLLLGNANSFRFELTSKNSSGTIIGNATVTSSPLTFTADTLYHMGVTYSTDASGRVTTSIFFATGNTVIDTTSATNRIATFTTAGVFDPLVTTHAFNSASQFQFGYMNNAMPDTKVLGIDTLRIYDSAPTSFGAVPEPQSAALILSSLGVVTLTCRRRLLR